MSQAGLKELLTALRDNLACQRKVMLADDLAALSDMTQTQQNLLKALNQDEVVASFRSGEVSGDEVELLKEIMELLQNNKLLARQSLTFARRMLEALTGGESGDDGQISPGMGFNRRV